MRHYRNGRDKTSVGESTSFVLTQLGFDSKMGVAGAWREPFGIRWNSLNLDNGRGGEL